MKLRIQREAVRSCPVDSASTKKDVVHNVIIDRCGKCGGIWLDGGELEVLKKAIETGADDDFFTGMCLGMVIG